MPCLTKGCGPIADETPSLVGCGMGGCEIEDISLYVEVGCISGHFMGMIPDNSVYGCST